MFIGYIQHLSGTGSGELQYLYVSLSNICNARCSYCDVHSQPPPVRAYGRQELLDIFGQAKSLGCRTVHFLGGGEPLVAPQFADAIAACSALGLHVAITTNGSHLAKQASSTLRAVDVDMVIISLDSHLSERHNSIRGMRGLWEKATKGIEECARSLPDTRLVVNHVLTTANIPYLFDFLDWGGGAGIAAVNLIPVKDSLDLGARLEQVDLLARRFDEIRGYASDRGIELLCQAEDVAEWQSHATGLATGREYRCFFPEHALYIDFPTGDVFPCDCTIHRGGEGTFELGNIWRESLGTIWSGGAVGQLRAILASPCDPGCKRDCDWNNVRTNSFLSLAKQ